MCDLEVYALKGPVDTSHAKFNTLSVPCGHQRYNASLTVSYKTSSAKLGTNPRSAILDNDLIDMVPWHNDIQTCKMIIQKAGICLLNQCNMISFHSQCLYNPCFKNMTSVLTGQL